MTLARIRVTWTDPLEVDVHTHKDFDLVSEARRFAKKAEKHRENVKIVLVEEVTQV